MIWNLLGNWKLPGLTVGIVAIMGTVIYVQSLRHSLQTKTTQLEQTTAAFLQCQANKDKEREASATYQSENSNLQHQLANARKLRDKCIPVSVPGSASGHSTAAAEGKFSNGNGVTSGYLIDFAGRCEETRLRLLACQKFSK